MARDTVVARPFPIEIIYLSLVLPYNVSNEISYHTSDDTSDADSTEDKCELFFLPAAASFSFQK
jgi:hypothetical protein